MFEGLRCPKCGGSNLVAEKRGFNAVKGVAGGLVGGLLLGPLGALGGGALAGTASQNEIYLTCLACKRQFRPDQAGEAKLVERTESQRNAQSVPTQPRPPKIDW
jgi:predicted lipid-binding transport protein (Tim44 family)